MNQKTINWSVVSISLTALGMGGGALYSYAADMTEVQTKQQAIEEKIDREREHQKEYRMDAKKRDEQFQQMLQQIQQTQMQMMQRMQ